MKPHVVIIGGGVIGLSAAYELVRHGVRVTALDAGQIGQESSWAGAGILPPGGVKRDRSPMEQLGALSDGLHEAWSKQLLDETGIDTGYRRCGGLEIAGQIGSLNRAAALYADQQIPHEMLSAEQARELEPALTTGMAGASEMALAFAEALHLPTLAQLRNPRHMKALAAAIVRRGGELRPGTSVFGFARARGRITAVRTLAGDIRADAFVLAAGAWSQALLAEFGLNSGIKPVRGQIVLLSTPAPIMRRVLLRGDGYLVPRADGRVLVGSTEEDVGFDKRTTAQAIRGLLTLAVLLVPALQNAQVERAWAGLRPGSPMGVPYIGRVADLENLFIAAGHFRAGLQLSPGTATLVRELVLGQPPSIPLDAFRLDRQLA